MNSLNYYEIGRRVRKYRKALGLSQEDLAEQVDISLTHMSHIETGNTKLSLPVLAALAKALGVHTDDLLFDRRAEAGLAYCEEVLQVLSDCSASQLAVILDTVKAFKVAVRRHLDAPVPASSDLQQTRRE